MKGSTFTKASAASRVRKMAMLPPSIRGPKPITSPRDGGVHDDLMAGIDGHDGVNAGARACQTKAHRAVLHDVLPGQELPEQGSLGGEEGARVDGRKSYQTQEWRLSA